MQKKRDHGQDQSRGMVQKRGIAREESWIVVHIRRVSSEMVYLGIYSPVIPNMQSNLYPFPHTANVQQTTVIASRQITRKLFE